MSRPREPAALVPLLAKVHRDERGGVSIETILIIGAIALPVLIFLLRIGWPRIRDYFFEGWEDLQSAGDDVQRDA